MRSQFGMIALGRLAHAAFHAVALILIAREYPVATFGEFAAIVALTGAISTVGALGLPTFIIRATAKSEHSDARAGLALNLISTIVAVVFGLILVTLIVNDPFLLLPLTLVAVANPLEKNTDGRISLGIARSQDRVVLLSLLGRTTTNALLWIPLTLWGGFDLMLGYCVSRLVAASASAVITPFLIRLAPGRTSELRATFIKVLPIAMSNALGALRSLDTTIVAYLAGPHVAGLYAGPSKALQPASLAAGSLSSAIVAKATKASTIQLRAMLFKLGGVAVACVVAVLPLILVSHELTVLLFGNQYADAGSTMAVILASMPATFLAPVLASVLQARGFDHFVAVNSAIFSPLLLVLVGMGSIAGGQTGAAIGLTVATWARLLPLALRAFRAC